MLSSITSPLRGMAVAALLAISAGPSIADVTLKDGTVLSDNPTFIVTYIEVDASKAGDALALIQKQAKDSSGEKGNIKFEGLQRIGQDNHFVVLEAWATPEDRAAHAAAAHTLAYRNALEPMLYAPYDERPHVGLTAANPADVPAGTDSTIYVVTHADIIPPEQFAPCERQIDPAGPCGNEMLVGLAEFSRGHDGNLRYDVLTQNNRSNHMSVVEMWDSSASQEAHQVHPDKKRFRNELSGIAPEGGVNDDAQFVPNMLTGSLWDERLYKLVTE